MKLFRLVLVLVSAVFLCSGCAFENYMSGSKIGRIPEADWGVNMVFFGVRGSADRNGRDTVWCPLFVVDNFNGGTSFRILGPAFPNLLGYIDLEGEKGFVTPIFSYHTGNLDSVCLGPLFFPVFRWDANPYPDSDYWMFKIAGVIHGGSYGTGIDYLYTLDFAKSKYRRHTSYLTSDDDEENRRQPIFTKFIHRESRGPRTHTKAHAADGWDW